MWNRCRTPIIFPSHFFIDFGTQNRTKMNPESVQIRLKVDTNTQGASKMLPRRSTTRPRRLQEAPKTLPRPSQISQEASRSLQKASQTLPKPPKTIQEAPQRLREGFKSHTLPFQFHQRILCYKKTTKWPFLLFAFRPWILYWCPTKSKCTLETTLTHPMSPCCWQTTAQIQCHWLCNATKIHPLRHGN